MNPRYIHLVDDSRIDSATLDLMTDLARRGLTVDEFIHAACSRLLADSALQNRLRWGSMRDSLGQHVFDQDVLVEAINAGLWPVEEPAAAELELAA